MPISTLVSADLVVSDVCLDPLHSWKGCPMTRQVRAIFAKFFMDPKQEKYDGNVQPTSPWSVMQLIQDDPKISPPKPKIQAPMWSLDVWAQPKLSVKSDGLAILIIEEIEAYYHNDHYFEKYRDFQKIQEGALSSHDNVMSQRVYLGDV